MRFFVITLATACSFCRPLSAEESPPPIPLSPQPAAIGGDATPQETEQSIEHLLRAAAHLEAAGLAEEAARVRQSLRARLAEDDILGRKEAELECLLEEIDRLRALLQQIPAVVVRVTAVEYSRQKLGHRARELDALFGLKTGRRPESDSARESEEGASATLRHALHSFADRTAYNVIADDPLKSPLFQRLQEAKLVAVVAQPTLTSTSRRPASFHSGGQFPISVKQADGGAVVHMRPFGVQVECVPVVFPGGRIRLQIKVELSDRDFEHAVTVGNETVPSLTTFCVNTQVELQSGQTIVIGRLDKRMKSEGPTSAVSAHAGELDQSPADDRETVLLVTPELMGGPAALRPLKLVPPIPAAERNAPESDYHLPADTSYVPAVPVLPRGLRR